LVQDLDSVAGGFVVVGSLEVREGCLLPFRRRGGFLLLLFILFLVVIGCGRSTSVGRGGRSGVVGGEGGDDVDGVTAKRMGEIESIIAGGGGGGWGDDAVPKGVGEFADGEKKLLLLLLFLVLLLLLLILQIPCEDRLSIRLGPGRLGLRPGVVLSHQHPPKDQPPDERVDPLREARLGDDGDGAGQREDARVGLAVLPCRLVAGRVDQGPAEGGFRLRRPSSSAVREGDVLEEFPGVRPAAVSVPLGLAEGVDDVQAGGSATGVAHAVADQDEDPVLVHVEGADGHLERLVQDGHVDVAAEGRAPRHVSRGGVHHREDVGRVGCREPEDGVDDLAVERLVGVQTTEGLVGERLGQAQMLVEGPLAPLVDGWSCLLGGPGGNFHGDSLFLE